MDKQIVELIGIIASGVVLISMLAKTTSYKGTMFMRIINTLGCAFFIAYGFLLSPLSFSVILMNAVICVVNIVYIIKEYIGHRKNKI